MPSFQIQLAVYITNVFSPYALGLFCICLLALSFIYLNIKGIRYREIFSVNCPNNIKGIILISFSLLLADMFTLVLKNSFAIQRPIDMLVQEGGYSFPSGHSAAIFAFSFTAIYLLFKYFKNHRPYINYLHSVFFILIAVLVGFSRLVLQVHRPIDVLGGCILGLICTILAAQIYYPVMRKIEKYVD